MRYIASILLSVLFCSVSVAQAKPAATVKSHALGKIAAVVVSPVTHPVKTVKLFSKAGLMSVLFAVETGVDGARVGLEGADKVFDTLSIKGKVPVLDEIYAVIGVAATDSAKLDGWLERQEQGLFGSHN